MSSSSRVFFGPTRWMSRILANGKITFTPRSQRQTSTSISLKITRATAQECLHPAIGATLNRLCTKLLGWRSDSVIDIPMLEFWSAKLKQREEELQQMITLYAGTPFEQVLKDTLDRDRAYFLTKLLFDERDSEDETNRL